MRAAWQVYYENPDGAKHRAALAFSERGALVLDKDLRSKGYRVDPHPIKKYITDLTMEELELALSGVTKALEEWELNYDAPEAEELRSLDRDLFLEHDERLRKIKK